MRIIAALAAIVTLLTLSPARAAVGATPFVIGSGSAGTGSATLLITTTATCPVGSAIIVVLGQTGATTAPSGVADSASNTYQALTNKTATSTRVSYFVPTANKGVASGSTITATYGSSSVVETAVALCWPGVAYGRGNPRDSVDAGATASSTHPAATPNVSVNPFCLQLVTAFIVAGAADTWTESTNYTGLTPVLATDALRMAWETVPSLTPDAYSATNSSSRLWIVLPMALFPAVCNVASAGGGQC